MSDSSDSSDSSSLRLAVRIANAVLTDLEDRGGFDHWWGSIDLDIRREIRQELIATIREQLRPSR